MKVIILTQLAKPPFTGPKAALHAVNKQASRAILCMVHLQGQHFCLLDIFIVLNPPIDLPPLRCAGATFPPEVSSWSSSWFPRNSSNTPSSWPSITGWPSGLLLKPTPRLYWEQMRATSRTLSAATTSQTAPDLQTYTLRCFFKFRVNICGLKSPI